MATFANTSTAKVSNTSISSAHPERFTQDEVISAIKNSKSKPLLVADGRAMDLADQVRRLGSKQISIVVLA